jgi:hypothetical protein
MHLSLSADKSLAQRTSMPHIEGMGREPLSNDDAKRQAGSIVRSGQVDITRHARQAMLADRITDVEVLRVLTAGRVEFSEQVPSGQWRYRILAGNVVVVFALASEARLTVVTVWRK